MVFTVSSITINLYFLSNLIQFESNTVFLYTEKQGDIALPILVIHREVFCTNTA